MTQTSLQKQINELSNKVRVIDDFTDRVEVVLKIVVPIIAIIIIWCICLSINNSNLKEQLSHKADRICVNETNNTQFVDCLNTYKLSEISVINGYYFINTEDRGIRRVDRCLNEATKEVCTIK